MASTADAESRSVLEGLKILGLTVLLACIYGVVHDQITARICVEYFTVGHPRIIASESPTVLGLVWGVVATWWVGIILGIPLAIAAQVGSRPPIGARELVRPAVILLLVMGFLAFLAGLIGHWYAATGRIRLVGADSIGLPMDRQIGYLTDLWAHLASYASGLLGGIVLVVHTARRRRRNA